MVVIEVEDEGDGSEPCGPAILASESGRFVGSEGEIVWREESYIQGPFSRGEQLQAAALRKCSHDFLLSEIFWLSSERGSDFRVSLCSSLALPQPTYLST